MVFLTFASVRSWLSAPTPERQSTVVSPCSVPPQQLCRMKQVTSRSTALHYNPGTCSYQFISPSVCPPILRPLNSYYAQQVTWLDYTLPITCTSVYCLGKNSLQRLPTVDQCIFQPNKGLYQAIKPGITHPFIQLPPTLLPIHFIAISVSTQQQPINI